MAAAFACEACGKKYGWNPQFAGRRVKCNCGATLVVPAAEPGAAAPAAATPQPARSTAPQVRVPSDEGPTIEIEEPVKSGGEGDCPSCGSPLPAEAVLCVNCGYNRRTGKQVSAAGTQAASVSDEPRPTAKHTAGRVAVALGAGAAAAVISGVVWAAIARTTGMELGIVAWGIGLLTGFAMMLVAHEGNELLGGYAALLAFGGLVLGKLLIVSWAFVPIITSELEESPLGMILAVQAVIWEAAVEGDMPETADWLTLTMAEGMVEASRIDGEVEPAEPPTIVQEQMEQLAEKAAARLETLEPAQAKASVGRFLDASLARLGFMERLKLTFSFYDALWTFLAVSSAYKLATGFSVEGRER